ncbi:EexN family lipoprotein [Escherichia coli]|nr:EexN family lipoprotein [Escherichia coli]
MTSLKTSIKTITYLSDTGCLEIQGASLLAHPKETYKKFEECQKSGSDSDNCKNVKRAHLSFERRKAVGLPIN